jgi:hypothetical protein
MIDLKNNALLSSPVCVRRRRPPTATELMNSPSPCCETLTRGGGYRPGLSSSRTPIRFRCNDAPILHPCPGEAVGPSGRRALARPT